MYIAEHMLNMCMMRLLLCCLLVAHMNAAIKEPQMLEHIQKAQTEHPRLLLTKSEEGAWKERISSDPLLNKTKDYVINMAEAMIAIPVLERKQTGRRLLSISRACIRRILCLGVAWRLTGEQRFLDRTRDELLAVSNFSDWNPSHFLDVGEMTTAVAIGYDWLFHELDKESKQIIKTALIEKGLKQSLNGKHTWFVKSNNNWNQVCHGGMVLGSLAIMEDEPELAAQLIARAIKHTPHAVKLYAPHGAYPEGPGYWTYGTSYTVLTIAALESALGSDFGLSKQKGLMESSDYYQQVSGPFGLFFNYSDAGYRDGVCPIMYWFARKREKPSLLWREKQTLPEMLEREADVSTHHFRFFPLLLIWSQGFEGVTKPEKNYWRGDGKTPIGLHRSGWQDANQIFVGIKGGTPSANHAHMDIGSFVFDAHGERWVTDLGGEHYHRVESAGVRLWGRDQDAQRWDIFRHNNKSHNTLVVNGEKQRVKGSGEIIKHTEQATVVNLSHAYKGQLQSARRGIKLVDNYVVLRDELVAPANGASVRWGIATDAKISIDKNKAVLTKNGKAVNVVVHKQDDVNLRIIDIEKPGKDYEKVNKGFNMLVFEVPLEANENASIEVVFYTGDIKDVPSQKLDEW